jgi:hypothetical protein
MPFYPAAVVDLIVRWERGTRGVDTLGLDGPERWVAESPPSPNDSVTLTGLQPRKLVIESNDIRTADTIKDLELSGRDFPFDPRTVRSIEVAAFMGERPPDKIYQPAIDDCLFVGFLDHSDRHFSESKGEMITFHGRDFTALFLDKKYPGAVAPRSGDLATVLDDMIHGSDPAHGHGLPGAGAVSVKIEDGVGELLLGLGVKTPVKGANGKIGSANGAASMNGKFHGGAAKGAAVGAHHTYWDVIQEMAESLGLVAYIDKTELVITTPRNITDSSSAVAAAPHLIWGENLSSLTIKKNYGRFRAPNVRVVSYRPGGRKTVMGYFPPEGHMITGGSHSKGSAANGQADNSASGSTVSVKQYLVPGLASNAEAEACARRIFEELTTAELEIEFETREMGVASHAGITGAGGAAVANLARMRNGDTVYFQTDSLRGLLDGKSVPQRVEALKARGYLPNVAQALAQHWDEIAPYGLFRVVRATHEFDAEHGYKLHGTCVNYIDISGLVPKQAPVAGKGLKKAKPTAVQPAAAAAAQPGFDGGASLPIAAPSLPGNSLLPSGSSFSTASGLGGAIAGVTSGLPGI